MNNDDLIKIMPYSLGRAALYAPLLTDCMHEWQINTPNRQAAFLAQVCHESGSLRYTREIASGDDYDVGKKAISLGNTPEADGDGRRYKGGGLMQITGKRNYRACGLALHIDLLNNPELLEIPVYAARSAGWFWDSRGLNELADKDLFGLITKRINGGYNGLDDRISHWLRARKVLCI